MTVASRKSIRDMWRERTRLGFVVAAIALGVAAFMALLASYSILTRELNRGYLATNPASAILHTDGIDARTLADVLSDHEVKVAEARRIVTGRLKVGPAQWRNLMLFVIPNFNNIRLNTVVPDQGAWPPATGEVLIERDAFQVVRAKIGDPIVFRIDEGQEQTLRVSGRVHDVGQPQARMENSVYGYITLATVSALGEKPVLDALYIQVAREQYDQAHIRQVAEGVKQRLEADGHVVQSIDVPSPGKHPHADLMATLLLAMFSFGVLLVALSGVLVLNFMAALMAAELRQIGIMKAIGGTRDQIAGIYLLRALVLGMAATVVGIPLGIWGSRVLCRFMAGFLNFDINSFAIPIGVLAAAIAVGLAVPVVACAVPVWHAAATPVRKTLAATGTSAEHFGTSLVDRMLIALRGSTRPLLFAVRNSFRKRTRMTLTCLTLASAGIVFMTALNLRTSMIRTFDRLFAAQRYDLTLNYGGMYPVEKIDAAVQSVSGVSAWENWIVTEGSIPLSNKNERFNGALRPSPIEQEEYRFTVFAMPPDSKLYVPVMRQGRGLLPGDSNAVVLNQTVAAQNPAIKIGDEITLRIGAEAEKWRVVGIDREPMAPPRIIYVPISSVVAAARANLTRIALADSTEASLERAREALDRSLQQEGIHRANAGSTAEFRIAVGQHMLMFYVFLVLAALIIAGVGGLGLTTIMGINVLERRREIGILRAIGATPKLVKAMLIVEGVTVALIAWVVAVLLSWPLSTALAEMMGRSMHGAFDFRVAPLGIAGCLATLCFLAALASVLPAESGLRLTVQEALAYE
jgi:putative ABC transport system permease protein